MGYHCQDGHGFIRRKVLDLIQRVTPLQEQAQFMAVLL
jgi:hypothetical protein